MSAEPPEPNCRGLHELFTSTRQDDHAYARTLCVDERGRPICEAFTLHGTWIGRLFNPDAAKSKRVRA